MQEDRASRFVREVEKWLTHQKVERFGIRTPSIVWNGNRSVVMHAFEFPPKRAQNAAAILAHIGKFADLMMITLVIEHHSDAPFYQALGYRLDGNNLIRSPALKEDLQPFAQVRHWWVNTETGDTIAVPDDSNHEAYLRDNQTQFGIDQHHKWSEQEKLSKVAAAHGWQPAAYDQQRLTISFGRGTQKMLRRIVQQLVDQLPVEAITVQTGAKSRELTGETLTHFLGRGRLPKK